MGVKIACCPEHGLHGERTSCFVCGGDVEQIEMFPAAQLAEAHERGVQEGLEIRDSLREQLAEFLEAARALAQWTQHAPACARAKTTANSCTCGLQEAWMAIDVSTGGR